MSILERINSPSDVKKLNINELIALSEELRFSIIETAKTNGGHLSSNLGIVEATIALCYVFDFPEDKLVFDVGHQCYAYKLLTGRKDKFSTIRLDQGISGFPCKTESEYDSFTVGHAGTSIASSIGLAEARENAGKDFYIINIVGDGSISNGLNLEAITSTQSKPKKMIVILNDNQMSISRNKNGFYKLISKGAMHGPYIKGKQLIKKIFRNSFVSRFLRKLKNGIKRLAFRNLSFFEAFGFKFVCGDDGNNLKNMIKLLQKVKNRANDKAVLLHICTQKGKGLEVAEQQADMYHGVGVDLSFKHNVYSDALGKKINNLIEEGKPVVAITAGMKDGTGLKEVEEKHRDNFRDVGISEEYAITLAGGMASGGARPIVAIYSTFMQRCYDQIIHDVCLDNLPVIMCIDRAGLVGSDGATHQGVFDISYLRHIPNITILAPTSIDDFNGMIDYAYNLSSPVAIRYPNDSVLSDRKVEPISIDKLWETVKEGDKAVILAVGPRMLDLALKVSRQIEGVKLVSARSIKPLDTSLLDKIKNLPIITLEENAQIGGFGSAVTEYYISNNVCAKIKTLGIGDKFVSHGCVKNQLDVNGLTEENVKRTLVILLNKEQ